MASAVESVQAQARDQEQPLEDVLQRAIFLASVLRLKQMGAWLRQELEGFADGAEVPAYRRNIEGTLLAWMPANGWVQAPISEQMAADAHSLDLRDPSPSLEQQVRRNRRAGGLRLDPDPEREKALRARTQLDTRLTFAVTTTELAAVPESVREIIVLWTTDLLDLGLVGENMVFSRNERDSVAHLDESLADYAERAQGPARERAAALRAQKGGLLGRLFGRA
ncbi:AbiTii domain-containing protein [Spiribacter halobius]|uniref:AbiTii domain-containing protein n=1 Tax=Sediminicurvatus halobius TaxID=2182432 RepID=A0A2U2N8G7_9GAMM|nr:hypothetical protein [Spiribacter halobius]PWG65466.1 hypothetical protein DEM34_01620 [Spiribacter halobius]UEX76488.1 hypothetical protein LMH63_10995 [Spiribacter halobius]